MTDLLRSLEADRLQPPVIEGVEIGESYTWHRGLRGATFRRVRLARQRIQPRLLGGRPRFEHWTIEDCTFEVVVAKRADFVDVRVDRLSLGGPFEAFAQCTFTRCEIDRLKLPDPIRFEDCTFTDVRLSMTVPDNVVFSRCTFDRVTMTGKATGGFLWCAFRSTDISGLVLHDSTIGGSTATDLALPATQACFYVPGSALAGPLAPFRATLTHPRLQVAIDGSLDHGLIVNADEIRKMGGRGPEAERMLEALWPYHIANLAEAGPGSPAR